MLYKMHIAIFVVGVYFSTAFINAKRESSDGDDYRHHIHFSIHQVKTKKITTMKKAWISTNSFPHLHHGYCTPLVSLVFVSPD